MKISQKEFDSILKGMGAVAKIEAQKALAPLAAKVALLESQNAALVETVKALREQQALTALTPETIRRRYDAIQ